MSFGVRDGTAEAAMENADENKARLQDNCMGKAAPQFKIVNGLTQFLEPTSRFGSSFSEERSLSESFGMRYADGLPFATFRKGLEPPESPVRIRVFSPLFNGEIPAAGAVFRSDLWRIEERFRIPPRETRCGVKLRWEFSQESWCKAHPGAVPETMRKSAALWHHHPKRQRGMRLCCTHPSLTLRVMLKQSRIPGLIL
jgi:hypothetical protein